MNTELTKRESKSAKFKGWSKRKLEQANIKLRMKAKESAQLGGFGNEMTSAGVNMVSRHVLTSLLGEAKLATTGQRFMLGLLSVGSLGLRLGLGMRKKSSEGIALLAAAASGLFSAAAERLIQALAGIGEAG